MAALILTAIGVSGCSLVALFQDSPTALTLSSPIEIAAAGTTIIFKNDRESDNCLFDGDLVTTTSAPGSARSHSLRFTYGSRKGEKLATMLTVATAAGTLTIDGVGRYALAARNRAEDWHRLPEVAARPVTTASEDGSRLSVESLGKSAYRISATVGPSNELFRATVLLRARTIYIRDGTLANVNAKYAVTAQHDCYNWDDETDARSALQRQKNRVPK